MEDKNFSSISKHTLNKGISIDLWKMEEKFRKKELYKSTIDIFTCLPSILPFIFSFSAKRE